MLRLFSYTMITLIIFVFVVIVYLLYKVWLIAFDIYTKFDSIPTAPGKSLLFGHLIQILVISWQDNCSLITAVTRLPKRISKPFQDCNNNNDTNKEFTEGVYKIFFGPFPVVVISSPEAAEVIFKRSTNNTKLHQSVTCNIFSLLVTFIGSGITSFVFDGDAFKYRKKIILPYFKHYRANVIDKVNKHFHILTDSIAEDGIMRDMFKSMSGFSDSVSSQGISRNPMFLQQQTRRLKHLEVFSNFILLRNTKPWLFLTPLLRFFDEGREFLRYKENDVFEEIMEDAIANFDTEAGDGNVENGQPTLLNLLIQEHLKNPDLLTRQNIIGDLKCVWIAAFDTVSVSMTNLLHDVGHRPDIQEELYKEISSVLSLEEDLSLDHLEHLPYLEAVVKESLRKNPPVSFLVKAAVEDIEVTTDGERKAMTIPMGSFVIIDTHTVNNNRLHWKNPQEFNPNRFLSDKHLASEHLYSHITFSGGSRSCPGKKIAYLTLQAVLAKIIQRYTFQSLNPLGCIATKFQVLDVPTEAVSFAFAKRQ